MSANATPSSPKDATPAPSTEAKTDYSSSTASTPATSAEAVGVMGAAESESASVPKQVTGAYLACAIVLSATDQSPTATIGCRFENSPKERVFRESLGSDFKFALSSISNSTLESTTRVLTRDQRDYEALIDIKGSKASEVNDAAAASKVTATFKKADGSQTVTEQPYQTHPLKAHLSGWTAINTTSGRWAMDQGTGLIWGPSANDRWTNVKNFCELRNNDLIKTWRLPTVAELRLAIANGLRSDSAQNIVGLDINGEYWTADEDKSIPSGPTRTWYQSIQMSQVVSLVLPRKEEVVLSSVCVAE